MPTREELYERLRRERHGRVSANFYRRTAEAWGYTYVRTTGSHMQFTKPGRPILTGNLVHGQSMHPKAVKQLLERIAKEIGEGN
jgi:predicted RNA binding protein YcfA (HicA-like mRNA interferase family)